MKKLLLTLACSALMLACSEQEDLTNVESSAITETENFEILPDSVAQRQFAQILSRAVYNEPALREFIKTEALKQFDNDYDVFYPLVKNNYVDSRTFKDILASYCTEGENLNQIEASLPLLNILVPDLSIANAFTADNWDTSDPEVAVSYEVGNDNSTLYCNGLFDISLEEGEIPAFPFLVVNNNNRLIIIGETRSCNGCENKSYRFADPAFDGTKNFLTRTAHWDKTNPEYVEAIPYLKPDSEDLDTRLITAYNEYKKNDYFLQRDYIYYGLTNDNPNNGKLNPNFFEAIYQFRIDPLSYGKIADQPGDPTLNHHSSGNSSWETNSNSYGEATHKATSLSAAKIIEKIWKSGQFEFVFDAYVAKRGGKEALPIHKVVIASAQEVFQVDTIHVTKHGANAFHHSRYSYKVYATDLKSKWVKTKPKVGLIDISSSAWDIMDKSLEILICVQEYDNTEKETKKQSFTSSYTSKADFSLDNAVSEVTSIKIGLGATVSETSTTEYTIERELKPDDLGNTLVNYVDPIITDDKDLESNGYKIYTYNTGSVEMMILPVRKF